MDNNFANGKQEKNKNKKIKEGKTANVYDPMAVILVGFGGAFSRKY